MSPTKEEIKAAKDLLASVDKPKMSQITAISLIIIGAILFPLLFVEDTIVVSLIGYYLIYKKWSSTSQTEQKAKGTSLIFKALLIILLPVLLIAFIVSLGKNVDLEPTLHYTAQTKQEHEAQQKQIKDHRAKQQKEKEERFVQTCKSKDIEAGLFGQYFVESQLKAPATADFPFGDKARLVGQNKPDCIYRYNSYVDSQNSFGANIRTKFNLKISYNTETEKFKLLSQKLY